MTVDEFAGEMAEAQNKQRETVRDEFINRVLRAPDTPNQSKRAMLGLDQKRRAQKSAPMFEGKRLF